MPFRTRKIPGKAWIVWGRHTWIWPVLSRQNSEGIFCVELWVLKLLQNRSYELTHWPQSHITRGSLLWASLTIASFGLMHAPLKTSTHQLLTGSNINTATFFSLPSSNSVSCRAVPVLLFLQISVTPLSLSLSLCTLCISAGQREWRLWFVGGWQQQTVAAANATRRHSRQYSNGSECQWWS